MFGVVLLSTRCYQHFYFPPEWDIELVLFVVFDPGWELESEEKYVVIIKKPIILWSNNDNYEYQKPQSTKTVNFGCVVLESILKGEKRAYKTSNNYDVAWISHTLGDSIIMFIYFILLYHVYYSAIKKVSLLIIQLLFFPPESIQFAAFGILYFHRCHHNY